ncbi:MAG: type II and III secretion system protein family protein [Acidobacteriaceae bacterium]
MKTCVPIRCVGCASLLLLLAVPLSGAETQGGTQAAEVGQAAGIAVSHSSASLRLTVGSSVFINTTERVRQVYISNPTVLSSHTASPRELVLTANATGSSSLVVWTEFGLAKAYSVYVDEDITALQAALNQAFPGDSVLAASNQGHVTLSGNVGTPSEAEQAVKMAGAYAKDQVVNSLLVLPRHIPQVRLKVRFVEVDRTKLEQYGFNFLSNGKNTSAVSTQQFPAATFNQMGGATSAASPTTGTPSSSSSSSSNLISSTLSLTNPLNLFLYNSKLNMGATIEDLEQNQVLQILAEPTITAISGHEASFLSGGEFPYPVIQGASSGFTSVTIMFQPYGVKLDFTPTVNDDGTIRLKVKPEVSALDYTNAVTISGYTIPALSTRKADTEVELKDGQSFGISGLLDHRTTVMLSKMPGIGDIPILGDFFRSKNVNKSLVELVIIVTPTIVDPLTEKVKPLANPKPVLPEMQGDKFDKQFKKDLSKTP